MVLYSFCRDNEVFSFQSGFRYVQVPFLKVLHYKNVRYLSSKDIYFISLTTEILSIESISILTVNKNQLK